jgi:hypothetical protein
MKIKAEIQKLEVLASDDWMRKKKGVERSLKRDEDVEEV